MSHGPVLELATAVDLAADAAIAASGGEGICAFLRHGDHERPFLLRSRGLPDDLCRALQEGAFFFSQELRRSAEPVRIPCRAMPPELDALRATLTARGTGEVAAFPLFGDGDLVAYLITPLDNARCSKSDPGSWHIGGRALEVLQLAGALAALGCDSAGLAAVAPMSFDGVLVVDRGGRIVLTHGLFRTLFGREAMPTLGALLDDLPGADLVSGLARSSCPDLAWREHVLLPRGNGGRGIAVALAAVPFDSTAPAGSADRVVFVRDLSAGEQHQRREGALELGVRLAHLMDSLRGALQYGGHAIASDLRRMTDRADGMVEELLRRSGSARGAGAGDVNAVVRAALDASARVLSAERVRVFKLLEPDLPPVRGDRVFLSRAFNLIVDVARASLRPGGGSLTVRTRRVNDDVYLTVSDDGAGRVGYDEERVGMPLFEARETPGARELQVVREVLHRVKGEVLMESRPGVWTRTTIVLPASDPESPDVPAEVRAAAHDPEPGALSILVIDDNQALRSVLRRYLERRGHRVMEASDGDEGLTALAATDYDRLIVDIHMPGTGGLEFYEKLESCAPEMRERTIFMTGGFVEMRTEQFVLDAGRPCIAKPFDLEEMVRAIEGSATAN